MQARCRATRGERNAGYACIRWPHMPEAAVFAMGICRFGMQCGAEGPRRVLRDFRSIQRFLPVLDGLDWHLSDGVAQTVSNRGCRIKPYQVTGIGGSRKGR